MKRALRYWREREPGDDPTAPYFEGHQLATRIEKILAKGINADWSAYEAAIAALGQEPPK